MANSKTTAISGPWVSESYVINEETGNGIAVIAVIPEIERNGFDTPTRGMVAWVHSGVGAYETNDQAVATARLIAAAPDLLTALEAVVSVADRKTVEFDQARAAIAKAKGVQNV